MSNRSNDPVLAEARPRGGVFAAVRDGLLLVVICAVIGTVVGDLLPVLAIGVVGAVLITAGNIRMRVRISGSWVIFDRVGGSRRVDLCQLTSVKKLNNVGGTRAEMRDSDGHRVAVPLSLLRRPEVTSAILASLPQHGDANTTLRTLLAR